MQLFSKSYMAKFLGRRALVIKRAAELLGERLCGPDEVIWARL